MEKLLSIVVPVYNVDKFIDKCLSSLLVPDKKQLELLDIVVINDGTQDKSADMARVWEKKYPDVIRVIDQENRGHGGAWNHGTELAVGKYIFYLDSDDWVNTDQFSLLIDKLKDTNTDLVFMNSQIYYAESDTYERLNIISFDIDRVYDLDTFDWLHTPQIQNATYITHCIYKTELLKPHLPIFLEKVRYDDIILEGLPIIVSKSFVFYDLCVYNYYKGRAGQSFDPAVRARNLNDVTANVKHAVCFLCKNMPKKNKRREFAQNLYESFIQYHYREISKEPIRYAKVKLKEWDEYVRENHSSVQADSLMKCYRSYPFVMYIIGFKLNRFITRGIRWTKNKLY